MKNKILIVFTLILMIFSACYAVFALNIDELIQIGYWEDPTQVVLDRNSKVKSTKYWHMDDGVLREGEDLDKFTPTELAEIKKDYENARDKCGNGYVTCGNHGHLWQEVINWGFDGTSRADLNAWYARISNTPAVYMGWTSITELINRLNSENPINILKTHASVFCIKHNHPLRYRSVMSGYHKSEVGTQFTIDDYYTLTWDTYSSAGSASAKSTKPNTSDWFNITSTSTNEKNNKIVNYSNIKFLASEEKDLKSFGHPLDGKTYDFAYIASFTEKDSPSTGYNNKGIKNYTGSYNTEIGQLAIWGNTGNITEAEDFPLGDDLDTDDPSGLDATSFTNDLYNAASAFDEYEEEIADHGTTVTVTADTNAGAVVNGGYYQVGPFTMSDYAYAYCAEAKFFSGKELEIDKGLFGGIIDGYIKLVNDSNQENTLYINGSTVRIVYSGYVSSKGYVGDNSRSGDFWKTPTSPRFNSDNAVGATGYIYPWPNSVFYIEIDRSLCRESETLKEVRFDYRKTETEGKGWALKSKMIQHTWTIDSNSLAPSSCTYSCTDTGVCERTGISYASRSDAPSTHVRDCVTEGYCQHGYSQNHYTCHGGFSNQYCDCTGTLNSGWVSDGEGGGHYTSHSHTSSCYCDACSKPYCKHGCKNGDHNKTHVFASKTGSNADTCSKVTKCPTHGHTTCQTGNWKDSYVVTDGQPLMAIHHASTTVTSNSFNSGYGPGTVRITTDLTVDKYIVKVEHTGVEETTFNSETERKNQLTTYKEENFIKLERGDKITFYIDLKNDQKEKVQFYIRDYLPDYLDAKVTSKHSSNGGSSWYNGTFTSSGTSVWELESDNWDWFGVYGEINGYTINRYVVELIVNTTGYYDENTVELIYRNSGYEDYVRTSETRANVCNGPVVNYAQLDGDALTKITDTDYYYIKSYHVPVDKYITEVQHATNGEKVYERDPLNWEEDYGPSGYTSQQKYYDRDVINDEGGFKKDSAIYLEYGDIITYRVDLQNTYYYDNGDTITRSDAPYYDPDGVKVNLKDTLPIDENGTTAIDKSTIAVRYTYKHSDGTVKTYQFRNGIVTPITDWRYTNESSSEKTTKGKITFNAKYYISGNQIIFENFPVTERTESYIEITGIINTPEFKANTGEEEYENKIQITSVRNINDKKEDGGHTFEVNNTSNRKTSSDYFVLSEYKAIIDNYVVKTDSKILKENANLDFEGYNTYHTDLDKEGSDIVTDKNATLDEVNNLIHNRSIQEDWYSSRDENEAERTDVEEERPIYPVLTEKYETVTYHIRVDNRSKETITNTTSAYRDKYATRIRTSEIKYYLQKGLDFDRVTATIYDKNGNPKLSPTVSYSNESDETIGDNTYTVKIFHLSDKHNGQFTTLEPEDYIIYTVTAEVSMNNMYLYNLETKAEIQELTNINNGANSPALFKDRYEMNDLDTISRSRIVTEQNTVRLNQKYSSDFIKLKDLIISGKVWLDFDKDGYMSSYDGLNSLGDLENSKIYEEEDRFMKDIVVKLYSITNNGTIKEERVTKTDENGLYTFAREQDSNTDYRIGTNQRVDKADKKDANGNYAANSVYKEYYVEYEYDGVLYKSTEVYSGKKHLDAFGDLYDAADGSEYIINGVEKYKLDSNAQDLIYVREEFNKNYQTISNNIAYSLKSDGTAGDKEEHETSKALVYTKDGHASYLNTDYSRTMTARSFLYTYNAESLETAYNMVINYCTAWNWKTCRNHQKYWNILIDNDIINAANYDDTGPERDRAKEDTTKVYNEIIKNKDSNGNTQITKYLWLYHYNENRPTERHLPETDYLKYINLGLEEREDIDISLTKDVYEVKTTINGEEMTYSFDQLEVEGPDKLNGDIEIKGDYLQDYIVKQPYGLTLYEADFKYRYEQYKNQEVRDAKGAESELNIEVTYKITVDSKKIEIDEPYMQEKDRELDVTIKEIMDVYDENFITFNGDEEETLNVIEKTADGEFLKQGLNKYKDIKFAEAWYYPNNDTTKAKVKLDLSNESQYSHREVDFSSDGYNTLYITGMKDIKLAEGEKLDIYIKYVVEKEDEEKLVRALQIIEENVNKNNERGLENIAQVNAYAVWYKDGKPASIVDCDSNVGNIGIRNNGADISVDHYQYYEDTAYKTGIEIKVPNYTNSDIDVSGITMTTEQIIQELQKIKTAKEGAYVCPHVYYTAIIPNWKNSGNTTAVFYITSLAEECSSCLSYADVEWYLYRAGLIKLNENHTLDELDDLINDYQDKLEEKLDLNNVMRKISGKVWDDSRSEEEDKQYHGNGKYNSTDEKLDEAKLNENVSVNYENSETHDTEERDILVRNAKVEYVEIIPVKLANGEVRYYEETLNATDSKWLSVQNMRTGANGKYELTGFIPGEYILRYTYGDDEGLKDMLIFNGHDYKSTTYTGVEDDVAYGDDADADKVIKTMEIANKSDARDDEIRRLKTMAYSETMVSKKAEVLKGTANGTIDSLKEENANTPEEYEELTKNTYMEADTVKFYVKPEKLKKLTDNPTRQNLERTPYKYLLDSDDEIIYSKLTDLVYDDTKVAERTYSIKNLDFGIEYRPETQITLNKAISAINLVTSDGTTLVKLALGTDNFGQGNLQQNIIKSESIGLEYTQFVSNDYTTIDPYQLTSEAYQGFVFINVDEEILQGSTIEIEYSFVAENNSEVDRISQNLDDIRFRDNAETENTGVVKDESGNVLYSNIRYVRLDGDGTLYSDTANDSNKYVYSATGTASQILYDEYYAKNGSDEYRKEIQKGYEDYYGRYLGQTYYLGNKATSDVIASVKFDKILDYVDTDLVFKSSTEEDTLWSSTTDADLLGDHPTRGLFVKKELFTDNRLLNSKGVNYVTYNVDKPLTSNLLISVDDRRKDADEYSVNADPTVNKGISKFLQPYLAVGEESSGKIRILTSKVISAETSTDDMQYENLAEIIQYTAQTGRRTNFATTIGNASATTGEFTSAMTELDTSATEVITLTPPTGLNRVNRVIRDVVETTGKGIGFGVIGVALVFAGLVIVRFVIKKIKKRPIK